MNIRWRYVLWLLLAIVILTGICALVYFTEACFRRMYLTERKQYRNYIEHIMNAF